MNSTYFFPPEGFMMPFAESTGAFGWKMSNDVVNVDNHLRNMPNPII